MKYFLLVVLCSIAACNSNYTPKPKGYFQLQFPKKQYQTFNLAGYPYSFEYPKYASVEKDSLFFGEKAENDWWINIVFPSFSGRLHISYKQIGPQNQFDSLLRDSYELTQKHTQKAYAIEDSIITTANGIEGMFFKVQGDVATETQFFLTDSTRHFLRGALYFEATPNQDSLQPVQQFIVQDIKHLIQTFRWKN